MYTKLIEYCKNLYFLWKVLRPYSYLYTVMGSFDNKTFFYICVYFAQTQLIMNVKRIILTIKVSAVNMKSVFSLHIHHGVILPNWVCIGILQKRTSELSIIDICKLQSFLTERTWILNYYIDIFRFNYCCGLLSLLKTGL